MVLRPASGQVVTPGHLGYTEPHPPICIFLETHGLL